MSECVHMMWSEEKIELSFDTNFHTHSKVSPSSTVSASTTALSDMASEEVNLGTNTRG